MQIASKIIICVFASLITLEGSAQKISKNRNCPEINSAKLGYYLLMEKGEEWVSDFLDNDRKLVFVFNVDSAGYIKQSHITNTMTRLIDEGRLSLEDIDNVVESMQVDLVYFDMCYSHFDYSHRSEESIIEEINSYDIPITINIAFPGEIFSEYYRMNPKIVTKLNFWKSKIYKLIEKE